MKDTKWRAYVEDEGDPDDAWFVKCYNWQNIHDAEDAADKAAEQEWNDGGHDRGINGSPIIVIIAPDGTQTRWRVRNEAEVAHYVSEAPDEVKP